MTRTTFSDSWAFRLILTLTVFAASACTSVPIEKSPPVAKSGSGSQVPWEKAPQGGGYYLDDGPGEYRPANLHQLQDAFPAVERIAPANTRPYTVMGQSFTPQSSLEEPYRQKGRASWYGRKFHGAKTANGEIYDMYQMTAAHTTLPLPSYARVTNLENGKSVIVRVNDRGPFLRGRIIDLSYAAAYKLDYINQGSAEVLVEKLTPDMIPDVQAELRSKGVEMASQSSNPVVSAESSALVSVNQVSRVANPTVSPRGDRPVAQIARSAELPADMLSASTGAVGQVAIETVALKPLSPAPFASSSGPQSASGSERSGVPASQPLGAIQNGNLYLQMGAFGKLANAQFWSEKIQLEQPETAGSVQILEEQGLFRVLVGPYASVDSANQAAVTMAAKGLGQGLIRPDLNLQ